MSKNQEGSFVHPQKRTMVWIVLLGGAAVLTSSSLMAASPLQVGQEPIDEPGDEDLPDEYIVWPVSNPTGDESAEDSTEPSSVPGLYRSAYLPMILR